MSDPCCSCLIQSTCKNFTPLLAFIIIVIQAIKQFYVTLDFVFVFDLRNIIDFVKNRKRKDEFNSQYFIR